MGLWEYKILITKQKNVYGQGSKKIETVSWQNKNNII